MSEPDLFVVCKNCSSEVSPYVTECPYCGQRVRKRAPKIDRAAPEGAPKKRIRAPSLPRMRREEIPGVATEARPVATFALVGLALIGTVLWTAGVDVFEEAAIVGEPGDEPWRVLTSPFLHDNMGYLLIALAAVGLFGSLLERRFGAVTPVALFFLGGSAGAAVSVALDVYPAFGANGAALGLLAAWLVEGRLAARRGDDRESDLLGVYVFAAVLLLIPLAELDASAAAGIGGALAGAAGGLILGTFRR